MKKFFLLIALSLSIHLSHAQDFKGFDSPEYAVGDEIILSGQLFQLGATKLMPEHYDMVLQISDFLESHKKIRIEIRCLTNETIDGTTEEDLMKKRCKSIYDRLVLVHDILPKRLSPQGLYDMETIDGGVGSQKIIMKIIKA